METAISRISDREKCTMERLFKVLHNIVKRTKSNCEYDRKLCTLLTSTMAMLGSRSWTKPSQPILAILTAGRAPARTRARDLVSNHAVWRLSPPQPSRRAARLGVRSVLFLSVICPSLRSAR